MNGAMYRNSLTKKIEGMYRINDMQYKVDIAFENKNVELSSQHSVCKNFKIE